MENTFSNNFYFFPHPRTPLTFVPFVREIYWEKRILPNRSAAVLKIFTENERRSSQPGGRTAPHRFIRTTPHYRPAQENNEITKNRSDWRQTNR